ncbi:MAG: hypothetical protein ACREXK_04755 [Gammaproteobacteria bacterium]
MLKPNPTRHPDPEVLARFEQALARTGGSPTPAPAGAALWPRFAGYYQALARLPRKARRALQRRWRRSLGGIALLCALGQAPALAATINVGGGCTLIDAITAANTDAAAGGCIAGNGADTLVLVAGSTHTLTAAYDGGGNGLPEVTSVITIDGNGSTIARDPSAPQFRILEVGPGGDLTLQETTVSGGAASDGNGGGVYSYDGTLTLTNSTVSGNTASGCCGGGISNFNGAVTLRNSTVSGNSAAFAGGGIDSSTLIMTNSTVSANSAAYGGGIRSRTLILGQLGHGRRRRD